jgi:hypothetical protein
MADFVRINRLLSMGLSTDTKLTDVDNGHIALETDTGKNYVTKDGTNYSRIYANLSGAVYRDKDVAAADTARRFETTSKKLRNVTILVSGYAQYFGTSATQDYPANPGDTLSYDYIDISTLYFKNVTAGQNGTVNILGVEE